MTGALRINDNVGLSINGIGGVSIVENSLSIGGAHVGAFLMKPTVLLNLAATD